MTPDQMADHPRARELAETRDRVRAGVALALDMERRERERRAVDRGTSDRRA